MSYKMEDITKMIDAGFTADEIRALDTDGLFTYVAQDPQPAAGQNPQPAAGQNPQPAAGQNPQPAAGQDPQPAAGQNPEGDSSIKGLEETINKGFQSIINAFQVAAVGGSNQKIPEAKTSEDILAEIISPYSKTEGGKK